MQARTYTKQLFNTACIKIRRNMIYTIATVLWGVLYSCHPAIFDPVLEKLPSLSWGRWKRDMELSAAPMPSQCSPALIDKIEVEWIVTFLTHLIPPAKRQCNKKKIRYIDWSNIITILSLAAKWRKAKLYHRFKHLEFLNKCG